MKLKDFCFQLPEERIARFPSKVRSESKLMVVDRLSGEISHHIFTELPSLLCENDFLVINNTKVDPVRLFGKISGKNVEMLIVKKLSERKAEVFAMPGKKFKVGTTIEIGQGVKGIVESMGERGKRVIEFNGNLDDIFEEGFAPLPPYIKRKYEEAEKFRDYDLQRYQTVYSKYSGSIAAPTAGLHFDDNILTKIKEKNEIIEVTLSVGAATFQKIEVNDLKDHKMGLEKINIKKNVSDRIYDLKKEGMDLVAIGTTSVRSLETFALNNTDEESFSSDIFIYPGFEFKMVDKLLTNFHLPESSLFILVSAFAGLDLMKKSYSVAIEKGYNFFSYGDAMLIK